MSSPNLGSDHPGLIEALAHAKAEGRAEELPQLVVCPHETVTLSAAHVYAAVTRTPQATIVHVDSGTQNMHGAICNAMRGRVPVLIFAVCAGRSAVVAAHLPPAQPPAP